MALTPPDVDEYLLHVRSDDTSLTTRETEYIEDSLQRATDLMEVATGIHDDIVDNELYARLLNVGILSMAQAIEVTAGEDRDAMYSPFSSERLGSYSYSKMQAAASTGQPTGVPEFDAAVSLFASVGIGYGYGVVEVVHDSEDVFTTPYPGDQVDRARDLLVQGSWTVTDD